jgi:hypothetical protein
MPANCEPTPTRDELLDDVLRLRPAVEQGAGISLDAPHAAAVLAAITELRQRWQLPMPHVCACTRSFPTKLGLRVHERSCPVEQARSDAWVAAVERGANPVAAGEAAAREALAARP